MTGKKKLNLGPLPEELDYSKYEETVTRWDRIIGVILLAIITLVLVVYIIASLSEPAVEVARSSTDSPLPIAAEAASTK